MRPLSNQALETRCYVTPEGLKPVADVGGDQAAVSVILLHGNGQTRHSWSGVMRQLPAHGHHVVNFDARGHGDSDWSPSADYDLAAMASDLRVVIATIAQPPALAGAGIW